MKIVNILILVLWLIVVSVTAVHHEIFLDETFHLNFLTNNTFYNFFNIVIEYGQSHLFYLILYPFKHLEHSYIIMQLLSVIAVFFSIVLLLFKSRFSILLNVLIAFSAGMIYFIPVLARPYALIPLFLFYTAILYKDRIIHPFKYSFSLILLTQTSPLMWGFCLISSIFFLVEKTIQTVKEKSQNYREIIFLFVLFISYSLIIIFLYKYICFNNNWGVNVFTLKYNMKNFFLGLDRIFIYGELESWKYYLIPLVSVYLFVLFKLNKQVFFIFLLSVISYCYFITQIWTGVIYQKFFLVVLMLIFSYWVTENNKNIYYKIQTVLIHIMLILIFLRPLSLPFIIDDIKNHYTNTKDVVYFLKNKAIPPQDVLFVIAYPQHVLGYNNIYNMKEAEILNLNNLKSLEHFHYDVISKINSCKSIKFIVINNHYADEVNDKILSDTWIKKLNLELDDYKQQTIIREYMGYNDEMYRIYSVE